MNTLQLDPGDELMKCLMGVEGHYDGEGYRGAGITREIYLADTIVRSACNDVFNFIPDDQCVKELVALLLQSLDPLPLPERMERAWKETRDTITALFEKHGLTFVVEKKRLSLVK